MTPEEHEQRIERAASAVREVRRFLPSVKDSHNVDHDKRLVEIALDYYNEPIPEPEPQPTLRDRLIEVFKPSSPGEEWAAVKADQILEILADCGMVERIREGQRSAEADYLPGLRAEQVVARALQLPVSRIKS